jgi:ABC-2 type transport system permease protein
VALFAILVGGWIIASEFQMGTIRLLMIRPKTRMKILMSKFLAALLLCLAMYVAGVVLNIVLNGICFGFADYGFPNFTVAGEVGFFAYYIPKFLACIVTIVFAYCVAFMLSVLVKNIAVAIAVPIVCFVGCVVGMNVLAYRMMDWIAYTPIPYVQISDFFRPATNYMLSPVQNMMQNGVPISLAYGIIMLLVLAAGCVAVSMLVFKKKDITH